MPKKQSNQKPGYFQPLSILAAFLLCGCVSSLPTATSIPSNPTLQPASTQTIPPPSPVPSPTATSTLTPQPSPQVELPTQTVTPEPTFTITPTPIPTYLKLRGEVIIDQAYCHYGPGAPYLFKYGVYKGSNLEILRRIEGGDYIEVQAIGGHNPCWVKAEYIKLKGDLSSLQPVRVEELTLPLSPYYASPGGVTAKRKGNEVSITWNALELRAGDSSEQMPYVIEATVCLQGKLVFMPIGAVKTSVIIHDEPGCPAPSHARFIAAEKHGYTRPVDVPWPPAE